MHFDGPKMCADRTQVAMPRTQPLFPADLAGSLLRFQGPKNGRAGRLSAPADDTVREAWRNRIYLERTKWIIH